MPVQLYKKLKKLPEKYDMPPVRLTRTCGHPLPAAFHCHDIILVRGMGYYESGAVTELTRTKRVGTEPGEAAVRPNPPGD